MGTINASIYLTLQGKTKDVSATFNAPDCQIEAGDYSGDFFSFQPEGSTPDWAEELKKSAGISITGSFPDIDSKTVGALLMLRPTGARNPIPPDLTNRYFILSFGSGWQRLNDDWLEPNFGRTVALNVLSIDQLLELRTEQVFALRHISTDRAPIASTKDTFNLDADRDLLEVVEGKLSGILTVQGGKPTASKKLEGLLPKGSKVRGGQSLRISLTLSDLSAVLDACFVEFQNTGYRKMWPEVDYLVPVNDTNLQLKLENALDTQLGSANWPSSLMLVAHGKRGNSELTPDSFSLGRKQVAKQGSTISTQNFLAESDWRSFLKSQNQSPSLTTAKGTAVHCFDDQLKELFTTDIFSCLATEVNLNNVPHILAEGRWFAAEPAFLKTLLNELRLSVPTTPSSLLAWDGASKEAKYNQLASAAGKYSLLDAKNIHYGGGQSKFEVCDFLDNKNKAMYFVKRADTSAPLSHLCEQVRRSVELLFSPNPGFRTALSTYSTKHKISVHADLTTSRPYAGTWTLRVVVLTRKKKNPLEELPLFAKCSLRRLAKQMIQLGHRIEFLFP